MENKLRKKFITYTISSLFILLFISFLIINFTNFSSVGSEADRITEMIENGNEAFNKENQELPDGIKDGFNGKIPPGAESREVGQTTRYFIYKFDKKNNGTLLTFRINSYTEDEALEVAKSLLNKNDLVGWTNTTYRYRIYEKEGYKYVVVIDQSRELRPSYRILYLSIAVLFGGTFIAFLILLPLSKRVIRPVIESDNKQKRFIKDATRSMKAPITIIDETNELLKDKDKVLTKEIDKQIAELKLLLSDMQTLTVLQNENPHNFTNVNITEQSRMVLDKYLVLFNEKALTINLDLEENLTFMTDSELFRKLLDLVVDNGYKYSNSFFNIKINKQGERLTIETINDLPNELKDSMQDRVFERFYRIDTPYTNKIHGNGMGLAIVKEIADLHHGRTSAKTKDNQFILKIEL